MAWTPSGNFPSIKYILSPLQHGTLDVIRCLLWLILSSKCYNAGSSIGQNTNNNMYYNTFPHTVYIKAKAKNVYFTVTHTCKAFAGDYSHSPYDNYIPASTLGFSWCSSCKNSEHATWTHYICNSAVCILLAYLGQRLRAQYCNNNRAARKVQLSKKRDRIRPFTQYA